MGCGFQDLVRTFSTPSRIDTQRREATSGTSAQVCRHRCQKEVWLVQLRCNYRPIRAAPVPQEEIRAP